MMKLLIGGSPCTHWSIAQTKNRETEPSGIGWELFKNYLVALEKYKPDFFLYENNKSMSAAIREQITKELGVEPIEINSALVSAQSRKRLYWTNIPGVGQPEDKGILLRDILETGVVWREKAYTLRASIGVHGGHSSVLKTIMEPGKFSFNGVAEPVRIGTIESDAKNADFDSQQYRVYSPDGKSVTVCAQGGGVGAKTGLYATPIRVGDMPNSDGIIKGGQAHRIYDADGKAATLTARPNGGGVDGPLYAVPAGMAWRGRGDSSSYEMRDDQKANAVTADGHQSRLVVEEAAIYQQPHGFNKGGIKYEKTPTLTANGDWAHNNLLIEAADGKTYPVYEVRDGKITIKGKQYPIKLADGFYIIRKLTVLECKRLQTVPEDYVFPVSDTQAYKMLGNGWTVDVIAHILGHAPGITTEPVEVLSMYDGMSCGHIALNKIGAAITKYYATEIDKYAIQTTQHNFPDTIQLGDAFQVRDDGWKIESEGPREAVAAPAVIGRPEELPGPAAGVSNAVIKYPGAKWGVAPWVISHFPEHRSYLEPFFGSGAVLFTKSRSAIETVNDIDGDVVNLFDWIRKDPARLAHAIRFTPYARDEYDRAWAAQYTETDNFRRAVNFYIRMMMGHGFRTTGEKVGWKNDVQGREAAYAAKCWAKTPEVIIQAAERLRGVQIENRPAVELIRRFNYQNVLIYADPPYMLGTRQNRKQYRHEMTDDDHMELLEAIKAHRGPAIISGYDSDLYNRELKGWYKDGRTSFTQTASKRREILWMNFEPAAQMDMFREE
ncbi:DNA cytosine methyltransferase [uncultured Oscillibacter sp.]|uniref:DNA cytosine methyltransferase n=1 Tax=uncultured Oscillibacter sp. TaxID=876091 RepID=UPI00266EF9CF|nr:DNA cytosine methyltransferase [uncultured Oscillibacter sp.]